MTHETFNQIYRNNQVTHRQTAISIAGSRAARKGSNALVERTKDVIATSRSLIDTARGAIDCAKAVRSE